MAISFRDYLANQQLAPVNPATAPSAPAPDPMAVLRAYAANKIKQIATQAQTPAQPVSQNMPIPTPPGQNPYNSQNMADAQAIIAGQNTPVLNPNAASIPTGYLNVPAGDGDSAGLSGAIGDTVGAAAGTAGSVAATAGNVAGAVGGMATNSVIPVVATAGNVAATAGTAAGTAAKTVAQSVADKYQAATQPVITIDPNTGRAVSHKNPGSTLAPYTAIADTVAPIVGDVASAVTGGVVKPAASAVGTGISSGADYIGGNIKAQTWDTLPDDAKTQIVRETGIDHVPTTAELKTGVSTFMHLADWPRANLGAPVIGDLFYQMVAGDAPFGLNAVGDLLDADTKAQIIAAYQKGGGKGVWQDWVANAGDFALAPDSPLGTTLGLVVFALVHAGIDLGADPLTWAPMLGEALKGVAAVRGAGELTSGAEGVGGLTKAINATGSILAAPNTVPDAILDTAGRVVGKVGATAAEKIPGVSRVGRVFSSGNEATSAAEDVATSLTAYQQAEHAANNAVAGSEKFPPVPGETPIYVSSDGKFMVTAGPDMTGQPGVSYRIRDQQGHIRRVAVNPKEARDLAERESYATGVSADAVKTGPLSGVEPTAPTIPEPAPGVGPTSGAEPTAPAAPRADIYFDAAKDKYIVQLEDGSQWPFNTMQDASDFKAQLESEMGGTIPEAPAAPAAAEAAPPTVAPESGALPTEPTLPPAAEAAPAEPAVVDAAGNAPVNADVAPGATTADEAANASVTEASPLPPQVEQPTKPIPGAEPTTEPALPEARLKPDPQVTTDEFAHHATPVNPQPGWLLNARKDGTRAIDWLAREHPDVYAAIKSELGDRMASEVEPALNLSSRADPIKNRLLNAEASIEIRDAAARNGVDMPVSQWEPSLKGRSAQTASTRSARMERVIFSPDEKVVVADRNVLYLTGDLRKVPPQSPEDILAGVATGRRGHPDTLAVPDTVFDELPADIKNYARSKKAFEPIKGEAGRQQYIGHEFSSADLQAMSPEQRSILAEQVHYQQTVAHADYQHLQDVRTRLHPKETSGPGIISAPFRKGMEGVDRLKRALFEPDIAKPLAEDAGGTALITTEPIQEHYTKGRLTTDQAITLEQDIAIGKDRLGAPVTMKLYERYDQLVAEGLTERQAALQVARDYTKAMFPKVDERRFVQHALHAYDAANQAIKENIQYNIITGARGSVGDMAGDSYTMLVTGHGRAIPQQFKGLGAIRRAAKDMSPEILNEIPQLAVMREAGANLPERYVNHNWNRWATVHSDELSIVRAGDRLGVNKRTSRIVGGTFQNKLARDWRNAFDASRRISVFADQFNKEINFGMKSFDASLRERAAKLGVDPNDWRAAINDAARERSVQNGADRWNGVFSPEDVRVATGDESLARSWRSEVNRAAKISDQESQRVLFSYNHTPADTALGRVMYFHYWATRALALHTSVALRNPFLIGLYARTWDGMNKIAEENGYPKGLRGFIQFMGTDTGFSSFFNPLAIVVPYTMFNQMDNPNAPWWQKIGLFLSPIIEGGMAAMGHDDSIPDITGTSSIRNMVMAVMDFADANGISIPGQQADGKPSEDYIKDIESKIYGGINNAVQGAHVPAAKDYAPYPQDTAQTAQIRAVIMQNAIAAYGPQDGWSDAQENDVNDAKARVVSGGMDKNPLSQAAYQEWATNQLEVRVASAVVPGGVVTKYGPLERMRALNNQANAAVQAGQQPTGEQQSASDYIDSVNAGSPEAAALKTTDTDYYNLGTDRDRALSGGWNAIAFGSGVDLTTNPNAAVQIGGKTYQYADIGAMSDADRKTLADKWVAENDGTDELAAYQKKRKDYVTAHPEYGDFKTYQSTAYNYAGGLTSFRTDTAKANPNFKKAMDAREALIKKDAPGPLVVKQELDKWAASLAGYEAATGKKVSIYDSDPIAVSDPKVTPAIAGQAVASGPTVASGAGGGTSGGSTSSAPKAAKKTTSDNLKKDIATYQQSSDLLSAMMAQHGMSGGLESYQNPYMQPWLKATFGDAIPKTTALMDAYQAWAKAEPKGADTSPEKFGAFYDQTQAELAAQVGTDTASPTRLMTLYTAWANAQPKGADISPDAFARYLDHLAKAA